MEQAKTARNTVLSIVKGIGILLMVIGHSRCPQYLFSLIYLFHMPLFFFASGFFCRPTEVWKGAEGQIGLRERILRRFRRLYLPFIAYSVLFLLLRKPLMMLGLVNTGSYYPVSILEVFLKMEPPVDLVQGFWFLRSLLIAAVGVDIALFLLGKTNWQQPRLILFGVVSGLVLMLRMFPPDTPVVRQLVLAALGAYFFVFGMLFKAVEGRWTVSVPNRLAACAIFMLVAWLKPLSMGSTGVVNTLIYMLVAPLGICLTVWVARWSDRRRTPVTRFLRYCGDHTMTILALHFLSFRLVSLLAIRVLGLPVTQLPSWPTISGLGGAWWILYSLVGIILPLLVAYAVDNVKRMVKR